MTDSFNISAGNLKTMEARFRHRK